jgi:O-6-methylguanine DNA methyltransferase
LALLEQNGLFAAAVFSPGGLFSTSIPRASRDEAIAAVHGEHLATSGTAAEMSVLQKVFDVYEGRLSTSLGLADFDFSGIPNKEMSVLKVLLEVPYGKTITYGQLAAAAGIPRGARFVGNVMARNRFAPLIPCHRVVSSSGLGGYSLGVDIKARILRLEGAIAD